MHQCKLDFHIHLCICNPSLMFATSPLSALATAACLTPTDPLLVHSIVKGADVTRYLARVCGHYFTRT